MLYKKEGSRFWWYSSSRSKAGGCRRAVVSRTAKTRRISKPHIAPIWHAAKSVHRRRSPSAERKTIGQLLDVLENDFKARKKDGVKNLNLIAVVRKDLADHLADALTTAAVTEYVKNLRKAPKKKQKGRRSKSLADSTINQLLKIIASAYELEHEAREIAFQAPTR